MSDAMEASRTHRSPRTLHAVISSHENNFTLLRAFLAASVIYYHSFGMTQAIGYRDYATGVLWPITSVGGLAVQAFFFLSGLFVSQSFFRDRNTLNFVAKRVLRIWPGYFACLVVTALLAVALSRPSALPGLPEFLDLYHYILRNAAFKLTWEIDGVFQAHRFTAINGPIHTLPMEAKMYAVLACVGLAGMMATPSRITVAGAVLLTLAFVPGAVALLPINLFDADYSRAAGAMFLAGVISFGIASWLRVRLWQGIVSAALTITLPGITHVLSFYLLAIWALLYIGQLGILGRVFRPRQDLSYGIYLYGWPCQQFLVEFLPGINPYVLTIAALALATAFAAASWRLVEKPAIVLGQCLARAKFNVRRAGIPRLSSISIGIIGVTLVSCLTLQREARSYDFAPVEPMDAKIIDFGPHQSIAGKPINPQPDGSSALWVKVEGAPPKGTVIVFDGERLETQLSDRLLTARVPESLLRKPGEKPLVLELRSMDRIMRSNVERMSVVPRP